MTENEKAVALFHSEAHPLARWAESKVVNVFADRIMATDGRKIPLNRDEAITTAQAALAYRLDPFMGEITSWVTVRQDGRRILTVMKGRDGILKIAKANARAEGTYLENPRFFMLVEETKRARLHVEEGDLAFECFVPDKKSTDSYYERVAILKEAGFTKEEIDAKLGDPPGDWGLGIVSKDEIENRHWYHDKSGKRLRKIEVKYSDVELCRKRALMAALRVRWVAQEFPEPTSASADTDDYIIDGEWMMLEPEKNADPVERQRAAQRGSAALYGTEDPDPRPSRPYDPDMLKERAAAQVTRRGQAQVSQAQRQVATIALSEACGGDDKARHSFIKFLFDKTSSKDLTAAEVLTLLDMFQLQQDSGGAYHASDLAQNEIGQVLARVMSDAHVGTLFEGGRLSLRNLDEEGEVDGAAE